MVKTFEDVRSAARALFAAATVRSDGGCAIGDAKEWTSHHPNRMHLPGRTTPRDRMARRGDGTPGLPRLY